MEYGLSGKRLFCYFVLALVVVVGGIWIAEGNDFFLYKYFAPKEEAARRQTYEQSKSYRTGSITRLSELCFEQSRTDASHIGMVNDVIRTEFAEWDINDVPTHLHACLLAARE